MKTTQTGEKIKELMQLICQTITEGEKDLRGDKNAAYFVRLRATIQSDLRNRFNLTKKGILQPINPQAKPQAEPTPQPKEEEQPRLVLADNSKEGEQEAKRTRRKRKTKNNDTSND
jgi:hypothetical protein